MVIRTKEQNKKLAIIRTNKAEAAVNQLETILLQSLNADAAFDWSKLIDKKKYTVKKPRRKTFSRVAKPVIKELYEIPPEPTKADERFKPKLGLFDKFSARSRRKKEQQAELRFSKEHDDWKKEKQTIQHWNKALESDNLKTIKNWETAKKKFENKQDEIIKKWELKKRKYEDQQEKANKIILEKKKEYQNKKPGAISNYFELVLSHSDYPKYLPQNWDIDLSEDTKILVVDYSLPHINDLPKTKSVRYIISKDEFRESKLSNAVLNKLYDGLLYQIALRTIHELFQADNTGAIDSILFNGRVKTGNKANRHDSNSCIMSLKVSKDDFFKVDLKKADQKAIFKRLNGVANSKLYQLVPVTPINNTGSEQTRTSADLAEGKPRTNIKIVKPAESKEEKADRAEITSNKEIQMFADDFEVSDSPDDPHIKEIEKVIRMAFLVALSDGELSENEMGELGQRIGTVRQWFDARKAIELYIKTDNFEEASKLWDPSTPTEHFGSSYLTFMLGGIPPFCKDLIDDLNEVSSPEEFRALIHREAAEIKDKFEQQVALVIMRWVAQADDDYFGGGMGVVETVADFWQLDSGDQEFVFKCVSIVTGEIQKPLEISEDMKSELTDLITEWLAGEEIPETAEDLKADVEKPNTGQDHANEENINQELVEVFYEMLRAGPSEIADINERIGDEFSNTINSPDEMELYFEHANKLLISSAEQGDPQSQYGLGSSHDTGLVLPQDDKKAIKWFRLAADQGHALAQHDLGIFYKTGRGVRKNIKTGLKWLKESAKQGFADAQYAMGKAYEFGEGVPTDQMKAADFYRMAAEQGHVTSQQYLGGWLVAGDGIDQNEEEGIKWSKLAAEQGDKVAQANLGNCYLHGQGVSKDEEQAAHWCRLAAEQGFLDAQYNLGIMYLKGLGVKQDNHEALHWLRLVEEQGDESVIGVIAELEEKLGVENDELETEENDDEEENVLTFTKDLDAKKDSDSGSFDIEENQVMNSTSTEAHYRARNYFEDPVISEFYYVKEIQVYLENAWKSAYIKRGQGYRPDPKCELGGTYVKRNYHPIAIEAFENFLSVAASEEGINNLNKSIYDNRRSDLLSEYKKCGSTMYSGPAIKSLCPIGCELLKLNTRVSLDSLKKKYQKAHQANHPKRGGSFQNLVKINETYRLAHDLLCNDQCSDAHEWGFHVPSSAEGFISWVAVLLAKTYSDEWNIDGAYKSILFLQEKGLFNLPENIFVRVYLFNVLLARILKQLIKAEQIHEASELVLFAKQFKKVSSNKVEELDKILADRKSLRLMIKHKRQAENAFKAGLIQKVKHDSHIETFSLMEQESTVKEPQQPSSIDTSKFEQFEPGNLPAFIPDDHEEDVEPPIKTNVGGGGFAEYELALKYMHGDGVTKNNAQAAKMFRNVAKNDAYPKLEAQFCLAHIYAGGDGVPQDDSEALKWYLRSAKGGYADAQCNLGYMYKTGEGVPQDFAEALKWFREAARKNNDAAFAQYFLGEMYRKGEGVPQDAAEAVKWYRKAAEQGDEDAQYSLGLALALGQGVKENYVKAVKWFRLAADQGHEYAEANLGVKYDNGQDMPKSYADAVKWAHEAIKKGDWSLQWDLGVTYKDGKEIPKSYAEALSWYCHEAEQTADDEPDWPEGLGLMYEDGNGVYQDFVQAAVWYRRAAERGGALAQRKLAALFESGEGVTQSFTQAYIWYSVNWMLYCPEMEDYEEESARGKIDSLENMLSEVDLEIADKSVRKLFEKLESGP